MRKELKCKVYDKNTLENLKCVVVCALYKDKLLLSRHKQRESWEAQSGSVEEGETLFQAAVRVLYEEGGVREAELMYACDCMEYTSEGHINCAVFVAVANALGNLPEGEIAEVGLFDLLPDNLTYPLVMPSIVKKALHKYYNEQRKNELN